MARTSVRLHSTGSYTKVSVMECMYICDICRHMYVCKEVLSVSTRKGTDICEFAQHGFIYKSICHVIYVFCKYMHAYKQEHSQWHRHM